MSAQNPEAITMIRTSSGIPHGLSIFECVFYGPNDSLPMNPATVLRRDEPLAAELIAAIHSGNLDWLQRLLAEQPGLAQAGIVSQK
jgi:hypothetical protein